MIEKAASENLDIVYGVYSCSLTHTHTYPYLYRKPIYPHTPTYTHTCEKGLDCKGYPSVC
ncbi:hypothetical protein EON63_05190 [archaeon]|nr:MAG: hypothetical protein EON63_05190 [archaeon]